MVTFFRCPLPHASRPKAVTDATAAATTTTATKAMSLFIVPCLPIALRYRLTALPTK